jgi:HlyD family secretion protein
MTATVDFVVEERKDVLLVPSAALRIKPTEEMFAEARGSMERPEGAGAGEQAHGRERAGGQQSAGGQQRSAGHGAWGGMGGQNGQSSDRALVWYLNENGKLAFAPVKKGATDGKNTEILEGPVKEGMQVIVSLSPSASSSSERTNPLTPSFPGRRR